MPILPQATVDEIEWLLKEATAYTKNLPWEKAVEAQREYQERKKVVLSTLRASEPQELKVGDFKPGDVAICTDDTYIDEYFAGKVVHGCYYKIARAWTDDEMKLVQLEGFLIGDDEQPLLASRFRRVEPNNVPASGPENADIRYMPPEPKDDPAGSKQAIPGEPYWLIERTIEGVPHWWKRQYGQYGDAMLPERWTTDANEARKYDCKAEAEYVMGCQMPGCVATEHITMPPITPPPSAPTEPITPLGDILRKLHDGEWTLVRTDRYEKILSIAEARPADDSSEVARLRGELERAKACNERLDNLRREANKLEYKTRQELDVARSELHGLHRTESIGEYWNWMDDGNDGPDSLTCNVLVRPEIVRRWVAAEKKLTELESQQPQGTGECPGEIESILCEILEKRWGKTTHPADIARAVDAIRAAFSTLQRERDAAREALKPFAEWAIDYESTRLWSDDVVVTSSFGVRILVGDLRRAIASQSKVASKSV
jgi:hypothetical protein